MTYEAMTFERLGAVVVLTINREAEANTLNAALAKDLMKAAIALDEDRSVRAVILTAAGDKMFCSGGDLKAFAESIGRGDAGVMAKEITAYLHAGISRLARMRAPLIGAINGVAAGAGLSLVCACDLVVASADARFTMAYTRAGLSPDGSSTYFLSRIIGLRRAAEMALLNRMLTADEALTWGLINKVVSSTELMDAAMDWAKTLASGPTSAFGSAKALLLSGSSESLETQMELEARAIASMMRDGEAAEGILSFLEKRPPKYSGR